jgi:hypothetical protein
MLFSNTVLCVPALICETKFHSYTATGKTLLFYVIDFVDLNSREEDKRISFYKYKGQGLIPRKQ